jgi:hypothetical protein
VQKAQPMSLCTYYTAAMLHQSAHSSWCAAAQLASKARYQQRNTLQSTRA